MFSAGKNAADLAYPMTMLNKNGHYRWHRIRIATVVVV
jgi:hypothetical protein